MKKLHKPDFEKSNVNISATLAEFLHAPNRNATLPKLSKELQKGYKNVVFVCFDGLGIYPMKRNLKRKAFLRKHIVQKLLSPFPATTTNATTSLNTNKLPLEHGWFGWSMHFANLQKNVNIFLKTDSWTDEPVDTTDSPLARFPYYFDEANSDYGINTVFPGFVKAAHPERNTVYQGLDEFFAGIKAACDKEGKQFVYAYCPEPDHTMHDFGVTSKEAKAVICEISHEMENLSAQCEDTLFVVTADHGQIDVSDYIHFDKDKKLWDMLKIYPYMEPRAVAFLVKDGQKEQFATYFKKTYGKDFKLFESTELVKQGYFGDRGDKAELLGDFVAVGTYTHKLAVWTPNAMLFKGHHTGLTEEMEVPLVLISTKR